LGVLLAPGFQHRRLAHLVDLAAIGRRARLAAFLHQRRRAGIGNRRDEKDSRPT
jgi:hypothetical protein